MSKKIKIQTVSSWSIRITIVVAILFICISIMSQKEFTTVRQTTEQYIDCEKAAKQLQDASDYLSEQVRMYAMTGKRKYMDLYFMEANVTQHREKALQSLKNYFDGTDTFEALKKALNYSTELMDTEYYSMRLVSEAMGIEKDTWPEGIQKVELSKEDEALTSEQKQEKARTIVSDNQYQDAKTQITSNVNTCMSDLITLIHNKQGRATTIFSDMFFKLEIGIVIFVAMLLTICLVMRRLIVKPLLSYNECVKKGEIFPVIGAAELQNLADTYNKVYKENQETQKIIRHQAEHDALTELLNRGSFESVLNIYENGESQFALILIDVDIFKSVNDTYGHAVGDAILKKVATLLRTTFRSIDYPCRIGGDEFALIMVEMTSDLQYTITEKINYINEVLSNPTDDLPAVSLSVGVAFADRENPGESIFKDADQALYHVKENGRHGCSFY